MSDISALKHGQEFGNTILNNQWKHKPVGRVFSGYFEFSQATTSVFIYQLAPKGMWLHSTQIVLKLYLHWSHCTQSLHSIVPNFPNIVVHDSYTVRRHFEKCYISQLLNYVKSVLIFSFDVIVSSRMANKIKTIFISNGFPWSSR